MKMMPMFSKALEDGEKQTFEITCLWAIPSDEQKINYMFSFLSQFKLI